MSSRCNTVTAAATLSRSRPSLLWPTLIAAFGFVLLSSLGAWQLVRLGEKNALIEAASARLAEPAETLPASLVPPAPLDFRRVTAEGRLVGDRVLYRIGASPAGRAGLRAVAPLRLDDGRSLLVDLGWLPLDRKGETIALPSVPVMVEGVLRKPEPPTWFTPANDPSGNAWRWLDLPAMAAALGIGEVEPMLLQAERIGAADAAPALPGLERGPVTADVANNHLQYAVTWFALAGGMAVIYLLFVSRHRSRKGVP